MIIALTYRVGNIDTTVYYLMLTGCSLDTLHGNIIVELVNKQLKPGVWRGLYAAAISYRGNCQLAGLST